MAGELTPQELEELAWLEQQYVLQQQAQTNPFAFAANDWGQGPGALALEDKPDSWKRQGDINDMLYDTTRMTGDSFRDLVPVPYKDVEQPDPKAPYQSDTSFLYSSNPVYQAIGQMVSGADGQPPMSLDQALLKFQAEYEANPEEFAGMVPVAMKSNFQTGVEAGDLDLSQIRQGAETYLTEGRKEQNSQSVNDVAQQEWEDYVRPRSQYEAAGSPEWGQYRDQLAKEIGWDDPKLRFQEMNPGTVQAKADRVPMNLKDIQGGGRVIPGMQLSDVAFWYGANLPEIQLVADRITSPTRNPLADAKRQQRGDQARANAEAVRNSPNRPMVGYIQGKGENLGIGSSTVDYDMNENAARRGFEMALKRAKEKQVASKQGTNQAMRLAAYRAAIYGQA